MKKKISLLRNWTYLLSSDIFKTIISFFVFIILARKLDPSGYGLFNTVLAITALFSIFTINLSASPVTVREIALKPEATHTIFKIVFRIRIITLFISIVLLAIYWIVFYKENILFVLPAVIIVIANVIWELAESIAFGHFVTKLTSLFSIISSAILLISIILLPDNFINLELILWIYASIFILKGIAYSIVSYLRFIRNKIESTDSLNYKDILKMSYPYFWMRLIGSFSTQIPILLLQSYSGSSQVGYYSVGDKFILPITLTVSTGLKAIFPYLTKLYKTNIVDFNQKLSEGFSAVLIFASTIAFFLTISSGFWIPFLFGNKYNASINIFNFQAWFGVLLSFDLILATILSSSYKQKTLAIMTTIDIVILLPLIFVGVQSGAIGLAVAKLLGVIIAVIYHIFVVDTVLKINLKNSRFVKSVTYLLLLMSSSLLISNIIVKIIIFFSIIIIYIYIKESPLRLLAKQIINKVKKSL